MEYLIGFIVGVTLVSVVARYLLIKAEEMRSEQIIGIYLGFGAPDENGRVGWYRDNRHGSPFTDPDSKWGEA